MLNPSENWDLKIGIALMAFRSAVKSSTGFTWYYLLYINKMHLPFDIIYQPPFTEKSHAQYANDVHSTLKLEDKTVLDKLHLANARQNNYYDRRSHGSRFKPGDSVWLWNPALQK